MAPITGLGPTMGPKKYPFPATLCTYIPVLTIESKVSAPPPPGTELTRYQQHCSQSELSLYNTPVPVVTHGPLMHWANVNGPRPLNSIWRHGPFWGFNSDIGQEEYIYSDMRHGHFVKIELAT